MRLQQGMAKNLATLYADLARDLDRHSLPRAAHGAFAAFRRELGVGRYECYAQFRGRTVQWLRLLRDAHRTFDKGLQRLLQAYGSARVLWAAKLVVAGQVEVDGIALKIVRGPGRGRDLADLTSSEVDRLLVYRPLRARRRSAGPATSGRTFELPRDVEAITAFLSRRLKTLKPTHIVPVPRFSLRPSPGTPDGAALRARSLTALIQLEGVLELYRDLVRELERVVSVEDPPPVMLRGQGRGERQIAGIAIENAALAKRLAEVEGATGRFRFAKDAGHKQGRGPAHQGATTNDATTRGNHGRRPSTRRRRFAR